MEYAGIVDVGVVVVVCETVEVMVVMIVSVINRAETNVVVVENVSISVFVRVVVVVGNRVEVSVVVVSGGVEVAVGVRVLGWMLFIVTLLRLLVVGMGSTEVVPSVVIQVTTEAEERLAWHIVWGMTASAASSTPKQRIVIKSS